MNSNFLSILKLVIVKTNSFKDDNTPRVSNVLVEQTSVKKANSHVTSFQIFSMQSDLKRLLLKERAAILVTILRNRGIIRRNHNLS